MMDDQGCVFCRIATGEASTEIVYQDASTIAFLDNKPLFPGHVLVCPREHVVTFTDMTPHSIGPLFSITQIVARAVENAVDAEGTFVAINNRVSQTVPHLHVHVVPRRRRDGLKGFFWPRHDYRDDAAREAVRDAIEREIRKQMRS